MIEEHSRNVTQILAVDFRGRAIDFKESNVIVSVELVAWWMTNVALSRMSSELFFVHAEKEAKVANVQAFGMVFVR